MPQPLRRRIRRALHPEKHSLLWQSRAVSLRHRRPQLPWPSPFGLQRLWRVGPVYCLKRPCAKQVLTARHASTRLCHHHGPRTPKRMGCGATATCPSTFIIRQSDTGHPPGGPAKTAALRELVGGTGTPPGVWGFDADQGPITMMFG